MKRKLKLGSLVKGERFSAAAITALVLAVVVVLNVVLFILVESFGWYLTPKSSFDISLSGATDALFASAIEEGKRVKISFCMTEDEVRTHDTGSFVYTTAKNFEERYPQLVELEYINAITQKNSKGELVAMSKYQKDMNGNDIRIYKTSIIFECGETYRVITDMYTTAGYADFYALDSSYEAYAYIGEEVMASMMCWVMADEHKSAYFTQYHGETVDINFSNLLSCAGYYVDTVDLRKEEIPEDADLLVISNPTGDFEQAAEGSGLRTEMERIRSYMERGGGIFAIIDPYAKRLPVLESFLLEYGIAFSTVETEDGRTVRNIVKDSGNAITTDGFTLVANHADGAVASKIGEKVGSLGSGRVILKDTAALTLTGEAEPILVSSQGSVCEADGKTTDSEGSYPIAALSQKDGSKVFVVTSIYLAVADSLITKGYANKDFMYALFENAFNAKQLPYGCTSELFYTDTLENLTMGAARTYLVIALCIPAAIAIVGGAVTIRRKNR